MAFHHTNYLARGFKAVGYTTGMQASVQQQFSLLQDCSRKHDDSRGTVADLPVLRLGKLNKELRYLVFDLHALKNGGAIVGNADFTIPANENFVHA
jgi:hypothetical protein